MGLYEILGVSFGASSQEILKAYKAKAREFHPDKSGTDATEEYMKRLNKAKDTLLSEKRVEYDETLGESEDGTFDAAGLLAEGITTIDHVVVCIIINFVPSVACTVLTIEPGCLLMKGHTGCGCRSDVYILYLWIID